MIKDVKCICGKFFITKNTNGRYCSSECRESNKKQYTYTNRKKYYADTKKEKPKQASKKRNLDRTVETGYLNG